MGDRTVAFFPLLLSLCFFSMGAFSEVDSDYISDVFSDLVVEQVQGWGRLGLDTAVDPADRRPPSPLRIGEAVYPKGLGHHATGALVFGLPDNVYTAFLAEVGVHWQGGGRGSVVFQVFVDGEKRFDSGVMRDNDAAKPIEVTLAGAQELRLVAMDGEDGINCDMANWAMARLVRDPDALRLGKSTLSLCGQPAPEPSAAAAGFSVIADDTGPQAASLGTDTSVVCVREGEEVTAAIPFDNLKVPLTVRAGLELLSGGRARVALAFEGHPLSETVLEGQATASIEVTIGPGSEAILLQARTSGLHGESLVRWRNVELVSKGEARPLRLFPEPSSGQVCPPRELPPLRPAIEEALIEWDWRMQDGIGTPRESVTYAAAIAQQLERGGLLISRLREMDVALDREADQWTAYRDSFTRLTEEGRPDHDPAWETLWLKIRRLKRSIAFKNPLSETGPLVFAKNVPSAFSHQLTQYYGRSARAGGGIFVLDEPGRSMTCRQLAPGELSEGSYMHPEVSHDGDRILFAYCDVASTPVRERKLEYVDRRYHLFEMRPDGSGLRQLTDGPYDDFSPKELPDGNLMFISTRRGGYHRCGAGPCWVYTLALADGDGQNPRTVSYHETNEWDPAVLADGRVIYTRWDYVDRNAVHYQHLWTVRPDGSAPVAYYGNNTFNPVGIWEARQVPGSTQVMATAAAHHAMTAGSILLLDTTRGVDGLEPITRLTPDAPFPESETHVAPVNWHAPGSPKDFVTPIEEKRWPGHCYRSPYPFSEDFFLAAYSFAPLIGEPDGNTPNMFGLYWVDAFGNKELLYRDLNISSVWPVPLRPRSRPPVHPSQSIAMEGEAGVYFVQDVYTSYPVLPEERIHHLRIIQVLPKTTPHANNPPVGFANASPGKQVLGTVPVEEDGSAYFIAPARIPLSFQALDEQGRAVQIMRSVTYLQPGEQASCVGCHEHRLSAPVHSPKPLALERPPSVIEPAPDGAKPLSYPILVQPVLDKHCVSCHGGDDPAGPEGHPVVLTGEPEGHYSKSYNVLARRVPYPEWGGLEENNEPLVHPDRFGARASSLMAMLLDKHQEVDLDEDELERIITWMDANALFYGTFNPENQARQLRGERIEGPDLE
jgi:hypothetical protein